MFFLTTSNLIAPIFLCNRDRSENPAILSEKTGRIIATDSATREVGKRVGEGIAPILKFNLL